MAIHDKAYNRAKSWSKALRKYHIDRDRAAGRWSLWYNNLHQYQDNSIHCSCPLCSAKTRGKNWSIADQKKIDEMESQVQELET